MRNRVQVLTFDDLQGQQNLPQNYAGFHWNGPISLGWDNIVGGFLNFRTHSDMNDPQYTGPVTMSHNTPFEFIGMCMACTPTAPGNMIIVEGWHGGNKTNSNQLEVSRHFQFHAFFYSNVDTIKIYSPNDIDYIDNIVVRI